MASVKYCPSNLPLNFVQNRVSDSLDISDMDIGQMSLGQMLRGQMSLWHLEYVLYVPRGQR